MDESDDGNSIIGKRTKNHYMIESGSVEASILEFCRLFEEVLPSVPETFD